MPILEIRNEYTLRFTYKCNWNCSYCAINNLKDSVALENLTLALDLMQNATGRIINSINLCTNSS